ncbi:DUF4215 domain-containing protein [Nannocystis sp.]|uniref:DUF4215 domain-containing protein n=1 Tax=Nannocystis sp. TaxID=1962667 RepID=UPI0025EC4930|nr:DUF4215 domain-containing protein [Nannocystis sp.]MBK7829388.1 DUF4215 domain-containing protein [Nannocystis sp.]
MARPLWLISTCIAAIPLLGCHVAGCREGDLACGGLSASTSAGTADVLTSSSDATMSASDSATGGSTGASSTGEPTGGPTTGVPAVCGDAVVAGAEECDDGNDAEDDACLSNCQLARCGDGQTQVGVEECDDGDADPGDECTGICTLPRCGDGILHPATEVCDDGAANSDNLYDGCSTVCQPGPRCGDGKINGPEDCDDKNDDLTDGCLPGCVEATSCLTILMKNPGALSGKYRVWPTALGGNVDLQVQCDMEADGGGYTFLKVDTEVPNASDKGAKAAELICKSFGMHLFVPRSKAHLKSSFTFATTDNLVPVGGGKIGKGAEYLSILAIFPGMPMATCGGKGLNSGDCPLWRAWDDHSFWVTDKAVPGEPSNDHCAGCSMLYKWNLDGTLKSYTTFPSGEGAGSYRFVCDIADKF